MQYEPQYSARTLCSGAEPGEGGAKTVAKRHKRLMVEDLKTGPKAPHSPTMTDAEEAIIAAFGRHTCRYWTTACMSCSRRPISNGQVE